MPVVSFSATDLLRGKTITPAWYRIKIESIGEKPANDTGKGPSTNYPVEGIILFEGDTGNKEFTGTPLTWNFNSKAMGFSVGFLNALGVLIVADTRYDLKAAEGREIDVFVENDTYQGRLVNRVNHKYRAPRADVQAA